MKAAIDASFGSFADFKKKFSDAAAGLTTAGLGRPEGWRDEFDRGQPLMDRVSVDGKFFRLGEKKAIAIALRAVQLLAARGI